jgi:lipooligosaccharide transport system permease protein
MSGSGIAFPAFSARCGAVWSRNLLVWRKLALPALVGNFGDPLLYLLGIGYGLGAFVGDVSGMPYLTFFASGLVCASAMNTATFESLYSAYTRMAVQRTWDGLLAAPLLVDDVVAGEALWAATKSVFHGAIILLVAVVLGALAPGGAILALPLLFLVGLAFASIALVMTTLAPSYDFFTYYFTLVITPMYLFSGVFFPIDSLPPALGWVAATLPHNPPTPPPPPILGGARAPPPLLHAGVLAGYAFAFFWAATVLARRRLID